jgi:hypothetical protein
MTDTDIKSVFKVSSAGDILRARDGIVAKLNNFLFDLKDTASLTPNLKTRASMTLKQKQGTTSNRLYLLCGFNPRTFLCMLTRASFVLSTVNPEITATASITPPCWIDYALHLILQGGYQLRSGLGFGLAF